MAVVQLATSDDVKAALGRDLTADETARVGAILDKASELFRRRSGQQFTTGTSTVRLKVNGGKVYLPQRPVTTVTTVVDDDGDTVAYTLFGQWLTVDMRSDQFITVTYDHGGTVPDIVRLCIADIGRKILGISPDAMSGAVQATVSAGPYSRNETYATWAQGGQTMLAPDDAALADSFKARIPGVIVQTP